ncbi:MAG: phosphoribosyltransferase family protein [Cellvibrionales bacterium]|nr:phosphoribosyltransferase family protein [Cellvibrionales bacterium]
MRNTLVNLSNACLICQASMYQAKSPINHLCLYCLEALEHKSASCSICDLPISNGEICSSCQKNRPTFDQNISAVLYFDLGKRLLQRLKTQQEKKYIQLAANLLTFKIKNRIHTLDYLTHTPRFKYEELSTQSSLIINLGFEISKATKIPFKPFLIKQLKDKPKQKSLNAKNRLKAVADCYECHCTFPGASIGIIDDILTTGSTMNALAKTLKDKGAKNITCLTLARTPKVKNKKI